MRRAVKLGIYGVTMVGFFTAATAMLPVIWVSDAIAGAYRKMTE